MIGGADEDGDMTEDMMDQKGLTKKDIHMLNEQRRRDLIKVLYCSVIAKDGIVALSSDFA